MKNVDKRFNVHTAVNWVLNPFVIMSIPGNRGQPIIAWRHVTRTVIRPDLLITYRE